MAVQVTGHMIQLETSDNDTALPLVGVLVTQYGLYVIILSITSIKNPSDDLIKKAISITNNAFRAVLKMQKKGRFEYEIEAKITEIFLKNGADGHAYDPIVASGKNACVLHYTTNHNVCKEGESSIPLH